MDMPHGSSATTRVESAQRSSDGLTYARELRHLPFIVVLLVGMALRVLADLALRPALFGLGDSLIYLQQSENLRPGGLRPLGYPVFLALFGGEHLSAVVTVQHAMALAVGVLLYVIALRSGLAPWAAALAVAPMLLTPISVRVEHFIMAEALFMFLLAVAAAGAWLLRDGPTWLAIVVGVLLACSVLTRTAGVGAVVVALLFISLTRVGWTRAGVVTAATLIPIACYVGWFHSLHGTWSLTEHSSRFMYGRVAMIANCDVISADIHYLCDPRPPEQRPGPNWYVWSRDAPLYVMRPAAVRTDPTARFFHDVVRQQPFDYLALSVGDTLRYFGPQMSPPRWGGRLETWVFNDKLQNRLPPGDVRTDGWFEVARLVPRYNRLLVAYQSWYPNPALPLGVGLIAGAVGIVFREGRRSHEIVTLFGLTAGIGLALLAFPSFVSGFEYRFLVPALPFLGVAAASGVTILVRGLRGIPGTVWGSSRWMVRQGVS